MFKFIKLIVFLLPFQLLSQNFERSELDTELSRPWEMTYGPDHFLWISEEGGKVLRVNPDNGNSQLVYAATDFYTGSPLENLPICNSKIQTGTLGLALHPEFNTPDSAYIYYLYSYNSGTDSNPSTKFKVKRLKWNQNTKEVDEAIDLITLIPTSYDHIGGRMLTLKSEGKSYLFLTIGDHGKSEVDSPNCYANQSLNPNNFTQDPDTKNGKIHRYNIDGTIPLDNPIKDNSYYTRGHRNPQGLMYNASLNILYSVEHGERTDDEINKLYKGMNYGWKKARGYHTDGNHPGELNFVKNYTPNSKVKDDSLVSAFYSWCDTKASTSGDNGEWCTIAPSDGVYYCHPAIPEWHNSLLVATLKDSQFSDKGVYQFKLDKNGNLVKTTTENPNPKLFFGEDQELNGRIRDIAYSADGKQIFLINTGGASSNKITVYTVIENVSAKSCLQVVPNPVGDSFLIDSPIEVSDIIEIQIITTNGKVVQIIPGYNCNINVSDLAQGTYIVKLITENTTCSGKLIKN